MWRNRFGRGCGPVVWQITDDDDDDEKQNNFHDWEKLQKRVLGFVSRKTVL